MSKRNKKKSFQKKVLDIVKKNVERKRISSTWVATAHSTTGTTTNLCTPIIEGLSSNNRVGHEIRLSYLSADLFFTCVDVTNVVRLVVYRKKTATTLATDGLQVYGVIDPDRYTVLKDDLITLSQSGDSYVKRRKYSLSLGNRKCRYDTHTGIPNIGNGIEVYVVSDSSAINHPTINGHWLLYYYDM